MSRNGLSPDVPVYNKPSRRSGSTKKIRPSPPKNQLFALNDISTIARRRSTRSDALSLSPWALRRAASFFFKPKSAAPEHEFQTRPPPKSSTTIIIMSSPSSLNPLRTFLRIITQRPARSPIETIVSAFVLLTLAYFSVLHSIKHSHFLAASSPGFIKLQPAIVSTVSGGSVPQWIASGEQSWVGGNDGVKKIEIMQVVVTFEEPHKFFRPVAPAISAFDYDNATDSVSVHRAPVSTAIRELTNVLTSGSSSTFPISYPSICYRPHGPQDDCFFQTHSTPLTYTMTLAFIAHDRARETFTGALQRATRFAFAVEDPDSDGWDGTTKVRFEVMGKEENITEMRNPKWVAYAASGLVVRFWDLAKVRHLKIPD
jgi:hypothetical protein